MLLGAIPVGCCICCFVCWAICSRLVLVVIVKFTVICCVNSVVMRFFIVLRLGVDVLDLTMLLVIDYECVPAIWLFCWFCVICV